MGFDNLTRDCQIISAIKKRNKAVATSGNESVDVENKNDVGRIKER